MAHEPDLIVGLTPRHGEGNYPDGPFITATDEDGYVRSYLFKPIQGNSSKGNVRDNGDVVLKQGIGPVYIQFRLTGEAPHYSIADVGAVASTDPNNVISKQGNDTLVVNAPVGAELESIDVWVKVVDTHPAGTFYCDPRIINQ